MARRATQQDEPVLSPATMTTRGGAAEDPEDEGVQEPFRPPQLERWPSSVGPLRMHMRASPYALLREGGAVIKEDAAGFDSLGPTTSTTPLTPSKPLWPVRVVAYTGSVLVSVMVSCIGPFFAEHCVSLFKMIG